MNNLNNLQDQQDLLLKQVESLSFVWELFRQDLDYDSLITKSHISKVMRDKWLKIYEIEEKK